MMASFRIGWKPDYPFVFHEGAVLGYRCIMVFNPEMKIRWVILTNTSEMDFSRFNRYFSELLMPVFAARPDSGLQRFEGLYKLEGGGDSNRVQVEDVQLFSSYLAGVVPRTPLSGSGNLRFKGAGRGAYTVGYEFVSDENGNIRYQNLGQLKWIRLEKPE
ncbi:MAG: hypothetical protein EOO09_13265 [Chitinophagaceae bacterium]|nr:MAG: hypothetical protein EOO09_13265 [Chitinophagaceae bacterium]